MKKKKRGSNSKRREFERQRGKFDRMLPKECANCGGPGTHIHHIVPIVLDIGTNNITNLVRLCDTCHGAVHNLDMTNHGTLISEAKQRKQAEGKWISGLMPYGYTVDDEGYVIENKEESDVVRLLFHWRYDGRLSFSNIIDMFNVMAIPTRKGKWAISTMMEILQNPIVFGGTYKNAEFPRIVDEKYREIVQANKGIRYYKRFVSYSTQDVDPSVRLSL